MQWPHEQNVCIDVSQLLGEGGTDPKGLEGRLQGEKRRKTDGRVKPREFFRDS